MASQMLYAFGEYVLDTSLFELRYRSQVRPIQPKPLDLLAYLVAHRDRVVLKSELLARVWPEVRVSENALAQAVACAREALADAAAPAIVSIRRRGYRFVLPVEEQAVERSEDAHPELADCERVFVVDAADTSAVAELGAGPSRRVRIVARSSAPFATFRALLGACAAAHPEMATSESHLARALRETDEHAFADAVVALFVEMEHAAERTKLVIEHLERADVASILLFATLASLPRSGLALAGTCAFDDVHPLSAVSRVLRPLAWPPRAEVPEPPKSGSAPRYLGTRPMTPWPKSAK